MNMIPNGTSRTTHLLLLLFGVLLPFTATGDPLTRIHFFSGDEKTISTSNILVSATRPDEAFSPRLKLTDQNLKRLDRFDDGTVIIFDLRRCPLHFDQLPSWQQENFRDLHGDSAESLYEVSVSNEITKFLNSSRSMFPGLRFALRGFPFIGSEYSCNANHQQMIETVDAFIPSVTTQSDSDDAVRILMPMASGRPIITGFTVNGTSEQTAESDPETSVLERNTSTDISDIVQDLSRGEAIAFLQSNWGEIDSPWDINNDGLVSGIDLALLMNYFSISGDQNDTDTDLGQDSDSNPGGDSSSDSDLDDPADSEEGDDDWNDSDIETLFPGIGFSGPIDQPANQGNVEAVGYNAKAIARWTELPYITRSENFYITLSAYHMQDIKRVEFFLDGGEGVSTREATPHPDTGYAEYMARVDVSLLTTGLHEIRAIAYPFHGEPRVLQGAPDPNSNLHDVNNGNCSFWFQYDASPTVVKVGEENGQFSTIDEAIQSMGPALYGGRIELEPGTHFWLSQKHNNFMNTDERKVLTVSGMDGSGIDDVILRSSGGVGFGQGLSVHIRNLTVLTEETAEGARHNIFQGTSSRGNRILFENLLVSSIDEVFGWGLLNGHQRLAKPVTEWKLGCWIKNVDFINIAKGINGVTMAKGVNFFRLSADAFGASPGVVVNLHVDKADPYNANHIQHCDIIQFTSANGPNVENRIFADITATNHYSQVGHLNGHPMKNFAFVRWTIDSMYKSQTLNWMQPIDHVVLDGCTFRNSRVNFGATFSHVLIRDTYMMKLAPSDMVYGEVFDLSTCIFKNFIIAENHSLPGALIRDITFASPSPPAGSPSDGTDGFIATLVSGSGLTSQDPFVGNPDVERRGELTNHFYYEASDLDLSWVD